MDSKLIERLSALAGTCRHYASTASDPEVALALTKIAEETEASIGMLRRLLKGREDEAP